MFYSELSVSLVEESLSEKVSKNVSKCIKMYAVKTEQQLATGKEAGQVIGEKGYYIFRLENYLIAFQVLVQTTPKDSIYSSQTLCITSKHKYKDFWETWRKVYLNLA